MHPRQLRTASALLAAMFLAVSGCTSGPSPSASTSGPAGSPPASEGAAATPGAIPGGTLKIGFAGAILEGLNPFTTYSYDAAVITSTLYPALIQLDNALNFQPNFAKSWTVSPDGLTWTFTLATGGQWSDGQPVTAADAAYTINLISKYAKSSLAGTSQTSKVDGVVSATATNDSTLVVVYAKPSGKVLWTLGRLPILPQHIWSQQEGADGAGIKTFKNDPAVSGGPFVESSFTTGDSALFKRNDHFYGPAPIIDGYGIVNYKNTDALVAALKNGDIDLAENLPATAVPGLQGEPNVSVVEGPGSVMDTLYVNVNKDRPKHKELLDAKVREAFDHAINRPQIVSTVWLGHATPGGSFIPPSAGAWADPSIKSPSYDPAAANQLLDQAGYKAGTDGVRVANGERMSYTLITTTDNDAADREFAILQDSFKAIGVEVTQQSLDPSAAGAAIGAPDGKQLDYTLVLWDAFGAIDFNFYSSLFLCSGIGTTNGDSYCSQAYESLYQQQGETVDQAARQKIFYQMQQLIATDRPEYELDYRNMIEGRSAKWAGFSMSPQGSFTYLNLDTLLQVHQTGQ
jgi:peptide/nickel transport system substrate-binding protein